MKAEQDESTAGRCQCLDKGSWSRVKRANGGDQKNKLGCGSETLTASGLKLDEDDKGADTL